MPLKPLKAPPKTHIANLASAIKSYEPVFVNDSGEEWGDQTGPIPEGYKWSGKFRQRNGHQAPNHDQLINTAAAAIPEIQAFLREHEKLKSVLLATQQAFVEVENIFLKQVNEEEALRPAETIQVAQATKNEHDRMRDVLHAAAAANPTKAFDIIRNYIFPNGTAPTIVNDTKSQN